MATIYRFIVEEKSVGGGGGKGGGSTDTSKTKTVAKKGRAVSFFGGNKGGVEHNRKMRAINPLLNKATFGAHEKVMRVGRAGLGLVQVNSETGEFMGLSGTAKAILIAFVIQMILKLQKYDRDRAEKQNTRNYQALENGFDSVHGEYTVNRNFWNGRVNYNQNK